jgi:hypothetical protein
VPDPQDTRFPTTHETLPCSAQNEQHPAIIAKRFSALALNSGCRMSAPMSAVGGLSGTVTNGPNPPFMVPGLGGAAAWPIAERGAAPPLKTAWLSLGTGWCRGATNAGFGGRVVVELTVA